MLATQTQGNHRRKTCLQTARAVSSECEKDEEAQENLRNFEHHGDMFCISSLVLV